MVSANLNFTRRLRIPRSYLEIRLLSEDPPRIEIHRLDLARLSSDGAALERHWPITLEGRARDWLHREDLGTIGAPRLGAVDLPTGAFVPGRRLRWRLLVVDADDSERRIAAMAEGIRLVGEHQAEHARSSLLPVQVRDLGHIPWQLTIDDDGFVLQLNEKLPGAADLPARPDVAAWLLPAVIREILMRLYWQSEGIDEQVREAWHGFAERLGHPPPDGVESPDDRLGWIDEVITAFCRRHDLLGHLRRALEGESA